MGNTKKWADVTLHFVPKFLIAEMLLTAGVTAVAGFEIIVLSGKFPDWSLLIFVFLGVTSVVQLVVCFYVLHYHTKFA